MPVCKKYFPIEKSVRRSVSQSGFGKVIVALSGGGDSIALLSALSGCRDLELLAAHCNFHLRGDESMRDQAFVEETCGRLGVNLIVKDFDVEEYIATHRGVSVEMACRDLRYAWFGELLGETGTDRIATGHHADDNIETMLLNLFRGSGTNGLKGMVEDTGVVWRPLLSFHRDEILDYLREKGLGYITDSSNLTSDYRRNFIRNEVLPMVKSRWAGLDKALDRSIYHINEEARVVSECVERALPLPGEPLRRDAVFDFASPELLVRRFIEAAGPFTTTAGEVVAAMRANKPDVKRWKLRKGSLELRGGKLFRF